jgi:drug/metabolite transporter (DMT)-like permease
MIDLILTILCSASIVLILKADHSGGGERWWLLAGNYATAAGSGWLLTLGKATVWPSTEISFLALLLSGAFVLSFYLLSKSVAAAGASLSAVSSRLSVLIPVFFSILFFGEMLNAEKLLGLLFALATFISFAFAMQTHNGQGEKRQLWPLIAVFFSLGLTDFSMKLFQELQNAGEKPIFLAILFSGAFLLTLAVTLLKKLPFHKKSFTLGLLLGLPNLFSSWFLIGALEQFPAVMVFPAVNVGIILTTALASALIWREIPNRWGKLAILFGIAGIIFLTIG